ncbi:MAG: hypothetical protein K2Q15_09270 [Burkholderiales bacterium]|nr:hypothetical protein [Burkholderiales bacterium]
MNLFNVLHFFIQACYVEKNKNRDFAVGFSQGRTMDLARQRCIGMEKEFLIMSLAQLIAQAGKA